MPKKISPLFLVLTLFLTVPLPHVLSPALAAETAIQKIQALEKELDVAGLTLIRARINGGAARMTLIDLRRVKEGEESKAMLVLNNYCRETMALVGDPNSDLAEEERADYFEKSSQTLLGLQAWATRDIKDKLGDRQEFLLKHGLVIRDMVMMVNDVPKVTSYWDLNFYHRRNQEADSQGVNALLTGLLAELRDIQNEYSKFSELRNFLFVLKLNAEISLLDQLQKAIATEPTAKVGSLIAVDSVKSALLVVGAAERHMKIAFEPSQDDGSFVLTKKTRQALLSKTEYTQEEALLFANDMETLSSVLMVAAGISSSPLLGENSRLTRKGILEKMQAIEAVSDEWEKALHIVEPREKKEEGTQSNPKPKGNLKTGIRYRCDLPV